MTPADYDAWYHTPRGRWIGDTEYALAARLLAPQAGDSLLDVGCGTGWFTRQLAQAGLQMTGLDLDEEMLAVARQRTPEGISWLQGDAAQLPFADASFDQVVALTSLCFVPDWPRAVAEMARVARRHIVLGLLNRHSLLWRDKGQGGGSGAYRGAHWHTRAELTACLRQLPLRQVRFGTAIALPSSSGLARMIERALPDSFPWGAFLLVSAEVVRS